LSEPATISLIEFVEEINVVPVYALDVALKPFIKVQNVQKVQKVQRFKKFNGLKGILNIFLAFEFRLFNR
jgi:hypothetical protein